MISDFMPEAVATNPQTQTGSGLEEFHLKFRTDRFSILQESSKEVSSATAIASCPRCGSTRINSVQMPAHCHFAAIRCGQCDRFLKWQPEPKNLDTRQRRQTAIAQMLKSSNLSQWERTFLEGLGAKKLSLKQQEILSRIEAKLEVGI